MKVRKYLYSAVAVLLGVSSCIYPYDADISKETDQTIVIEGEVLVGGTTTIRLSYLTELGSLASSRHPAGRAWVEDRDGNRFESSNKSLSWNISIPTETAPSGKQYRAVIEVDGETYVSEWLDADPKPTINGIHFGSDGVKVTVYVDVDAQACHSGYMGFSFDETWEFHADFIPEVVVNPNGWQYSDMMGAWPFYWCYRSSVSQQMVLLDYSALEGAQTKQYPVHSFLCIDSRNHQKYSILVKAFALSRDAYLYNKQTQDMSELGGDLFSPEPGMLQGNLTCTTDDGRQVMGLILAAEVATKRAFLDNRYLRVTRQDDSFMVEVPEEKMPVYYYDMNYRPIKYVTMEDRQVVGWGPHRCINCLEAGGTQEKPAFWDDDKQ